MSARDELRRMLDERGVDWDYGITGGERMSADFDLNMAYNMGYDDALARRKPDASKVHILGRGTCKADKLCDGYLYYTSYWCRGCDERFAYRPIGDKDRGALPKFCPNCGEKVVTND